MLFGSKNNVIGGQKFIFLGLIIVIFGDNMQYTVLNNDEMEQEYRAKGSEGEFEGNRLQVEKFFFDQLWKTFCKEIVFIPIHHSKHHHYSLIVINKKKRTIVHMNSMQPNRKESKKHFSTTNAATVVSI